MEKLLLLFLVLVISVPQAVAGPADKIISRYKKAVGEKQAAKLKSTVVTGTISAGQSAPGSLLLRSASDGAFRIDIESGAYKLTECYNGRSAWRRDSSGLRTLIGTEAGRMRLRSLLAAGRLLDISKRKISALPADKEKIDGTDAQAVDFSIGDARVRIYFDSASGLPVKQVHETPEGDEEIFFSDYRKVDGVMEAHALKIKNKAGEFLVTVDRVEHNTTIEKTAYNFPLVEGAVPLPDLEQLLKDVYANQTKLEQLREQYTFRETTVERELDGDGRVKKTETRVYDVIPVSRTFVRKLISVNGKELTASEIEKEDKKFKKEVEEVRKRKEKELKKEAKRKQREEDEDGDEERLTILDFLRISNFTAGRREQFRGHEVIAFDYEPRKDFKPKNRVENIISKLAGTIFVDEQAHQIVRLEARLTEAFKVGGGLLASVQPSSAFVFEQEKVRGELWLPSFAEANLSAKALLFVKFNASNTTRYSDYKKYQTDVDLKFEEREQ